MKNKIIEYIQKKYPKLDVKELCSQTYLSDEYVEYLVEENDNEMIEVWCHSVEMSRRLIFMFIPLDFEHFLYHFNELDK